MMEYNGTEFKPREVPPPADYQVRVIDATSKISQKGNDMIELVVEIEDGKFKGERMWDYIVAGEWMVKKVGQILSAMGEDPSVKLNLTPDTFKGKRGLVSTKVDEDRAVIKYWKVAKKETEEAPF